MDTELCKKPLTTDPLDIPSLVYPESLSTGTRLEDDNVPFTKHGLEERKEKGQPDHSLLCIILIA